MGNFIILGFSALRNTMPFAWLQRLRDRIRPRSEGSASSTTPDLMEGVPENLQEQFNVIFNAVNHVESCANIPCGTCMSGVALVKEISGNSALDQERIGDLMAERTSFSRMLISCWQKKELLEMFTDASATDTLLKEAQRSFEFYRALAGICWNYTDESNPFCLSIEEEGRLSIIVDWMLSLQDNTLNKWATEIVFNVLNILHNTCRRVEDIRRSHRQIVPALEKLTASEDPIVQACAFMSLSYMVDKEEADKLTTNSACVDNLLSLLRQSLENVEHKIRITRSTGTDAFSRGYTLSAIELVQGIKQLAINDDNKRLIAEKDGITIISSMLKMGLIKECSSQEKRYATEALWQLAFRQENVKRIKEDKDLIKELKNLSLTSNHALSQACKGVLLTMTSTASQHIMISYKWEKLSKSVMSEIKSQLISKGYNVWMDEDRMEARYALVKQKRIVPVKVNEAFKASGWLGAITAGKMYYLIQNEKQVPSQLPTIIDREIEHELQKNPDVQSGARSGGPVEPEVRTWDATKVREWLTSNGISSTNECLRNLTGFHLLQLKKQLARAPDSLYPSMKEDLKVPYLEVLLLAAALENL